MSSVFVAVVSVASVVKNPVKSLVSEKGVKCSGVQKKLRLDEGLAIN